MKNDIQKDTKNIQNLTGLEEFEKLKIEKGENIHQWYKKSLVALLTAMSLTLANIQFAHADKIKYIVKKDTIYFELDNNPKNGLEPISNYYLLQSLKATNAKTSKAFLEIARALPELSSENKNLRKEAIETLVTHKDLVIEHSEKTITRVMKRVLNKNVEYIPHSVGHSYNGYLPNHTVITKKDAEEHAIAENEIFSDYDKEIPKPIIQTMDARYNLMAGTLTDKNKKAFSEETKKLAYRTMEIDEKKFKVKDGKILEVKDSPKLSIGFTELTKEQKKQFLQRQIDLRNRSNEDKSNIQTLKSIMEQSKN